MGEAARNTHNFDLNLDTPRARPRQNDEDSHAEDEPELLVTDQMSTSNTPCARMWVVRVAENDKDPGRSEAKPKSCKNDYSLGVSDTHHPTKR